MIQKIKPKGMKVKYIAESDFPYLTKGKIYDVLSIERGWYRVETDHVGDYLFMPMSFEIIDYGDFKMQ